MLTVRLPFTLCLQDTSELQRLAALNGVMGLLGSEQSLFIVSKLTKHRFILEKIIASLQKNFMIKRNIIPAMRASISVLKSFSLPSSVSLGWFTNACFIARNKLRRPWFAIYREQRNCLVNFDQGRPLLP